MAVRDLSPSNWAAPGTAQFSSNIVLSSESSSPLPTDVFISNYSYTSKILTDLSSGANTITLPSTNVRFVRVVPPVGSSTSIIAKGVSGDTGFGINPNGYIEFTPVASLASFVLTTGGAIVGVTIYYG